MLKIILILFTISCSQFVFASTAPTQNYSVLSFNIRYNTPKDGVNAWPNRKKQVADLIRFYQSDIVGLQEARLSQLHDLSVLLPQYNRYGLARADGKPNSLGEYAAILYRKDKLTIVDKGSFWCSTTPNIPSKGSDAMFKRNVNWLYLKPKQGISFYIFNTHFDHKGNLTNSNCAKLIRQRIDNITRYSPVILTGDFNSKPSSQTYMNIVNNTPYKIKIVNARKISKIKPYGPTFTFTGFDINANGNSPIDYIFVSDKIKVNRFGILTDSLNGHLPSDHYPVFTDITF